MHWLAICTQIFAIVYFTDAVTHLEIYPGLQCSYNYDLVVHTHRGERSTKELNFKINAKVCLVDSICWISWCIHFTIFYTQCTFYLHVGVRFLQFTCICTLNYDFISPLKSACFYLSAMPLLHLCRTA